MSIEEFNFYIHKLVEELKSLDPYKIVLFGSYAWGTPTRNSDIDLLVILNNEDFSSSYMDMLKKRAMVRNKILGINRDVAIDLVVYSKSELKKMIELESVFVKTILEKGIILYEKANKRVA